MRPRYRSACLFALAAALVLLVLATRAAAQCPGGVCPARPATVPPAPHHGYGAPHPLLPSSGNQYAFYPSGFMMNGVYYPPGYYLATSPTVAPPVYGAHRRGFFGGGFR